MKKQRMNYKMVLTACAWAVALAALQADVKLPSIFSDHMVLQRDVAAPVWGWAEPGENVSISIGSQTKTAVAGPDGKWSVKLEPLKAGGPLMLTVKAKNTITINDVLVGEVWLGSGQSNMALQVQRASEFPAEQAAAKTPEIRVFTVGRNQVSAPTTNCAGEWKICSPETVGQFSAMAFFFGRELYRALKVPMGLINSSVGGTPIESWISADAQNNQPECKAYLAQQNKAVAKTDLTAAKAKYEKDFAKWKTKAAEAKKAGQKAPRAPRDPVALSERKGNVAGLFNGMSAPLIPYAMRGAIWYQGEANSAPEKAPFYQYQLPCLIQDWRARWGQGDFPFAWVQLPNYEAPGRDWPTMRECMMKSLRVPNTGMAIAIDVGEAKNIHPQNKQAVGRRLSLWALGTVYGQKCTISGPLPDGFEFKGSECVVKFKHADGGLVAKGGDLKGFVVAGSDKKFVPASARIEGNQVIVSSPEVKQPAAVRYAWENYPLCNLYSGAELPASPFRTDEWPAGVPAR